MAVLEMHSVHSAEEDEEVSTRRSRLRPSGAGGGRRRKVLGVAVAEQFWINVPSPEPTMAEC